jgi:hypothetical protein
MVRFHRRIGAFVLAGSMVTGCSGGSSGPAPAPLTTPTATPAGATAAPSSTPAPSPTPTTAPIFPGVPTNPPSMGNTACAAPSEPVPGDYTSFETSGNVVGNTYTEGASAGSNFYTATEYDAPTPAPTATATATIPTPTPTATPVPSPTPSPTATPGSPGTAAPTPVPSASSTAGVVLTTEYFGTYTLPSFGIGAAFTGCFSLALSQPEGGSAGQDRHRATATNDIATGGGSPNLSPYGTAIDTGSGSIVSFTIDNLTQTTGDGTFTFDNDVAGTVTITGSQSYYGFARRRADPYRKGLVPSGRGSFAH